jgi:hypothetical protein
MAPRIDTLRAQVRREGFDTRRSELWRYMLDHRPQIAEMRGEGATWRAIGEAMRKLGLLDRDKKPPTNETVRQTWAKIDKGPKPEVRRRPPRARPLLPEEMPQAAPERSGGGAGLAAEPEQPRRKFRRGATFRGTEEVEDGKA